MVAELISFPMRLQSNGRLALVEQDSLDHIGEELAILVLSRPGERDLVPTFGIEDPAFEGGISKEEISSQVATFAIPAEITEVHGRPTDDTNVDVLIAFEPVMLDTDVMVDSDDTDVEIFDA